MTSSRDYQRIERAIDYVETSHPRRVSLPEIAREIGLSEFHFQKLFKRWAGISPKKFLQYLTLERAKAALDENKDLLAAAYDSGLSGPGRLHDLFVTVEAMTPGEYKLKGHGIEISYGFQNTPFGLCLIGITSRGVCHLSFLASDRKAALQELKERWPRARFAANASLAKKAASRIFAPRRSSTPLKVLLAGSGFQLKVWEALLRVPSGSTCSYGDLARLIGNPGASRAVGSAMARNAVAFLIPCHRVIQSKGIVGNYRWGSTRKRAILALEKAAKENR